MAKHCERLKQALELRNIKPSMLAYKTGISEASISHYIAGHYVPKSDKMEKMASALRVSSAWLSGYDVPINNITGSGFQDNSQRQVGVKIPVLGYVAAGIPLEAITEILDYEEIHADMLKDGSEYFALQIKGSSMEPRIKNGDVVIVRKQPDCNSGDVAIVSVNGDDATCKRIMKHESGITLVPFNPAFETMFFPNNEIIEKPITIWGKVVELRAKNI